MAKLSIEVTSEEMATWAEVMHKLVNAWNEHVATEPTPEQSAQMQARLIEHFPGIEPYLQPKKKNRRYYARAKN